MSDCSMKAMKPKEPPCLEPKTCGNCDKFVRANGYEHLGICSEIYFEDEYGNDAFAAVRDTRQCDNPSLFRPRTGTLEQRYQQLEHVAKEMHKALHRPYTLPDTKVYEKISFRKQLEALGVSLND